MICSRKTQPLYFMCVSILSRPLR